MMAAAVWWFIFCVITAAALPWMCSAMMMSYFNVDV